MEQRSDGQDHNSTNFERRSVMTSSLTSKFFIRYSVFCGLPGGLDLEFLCTAKGMNPAFTFDLVTRWVKRG